MMHSYFIPVVYISLDGFCCFGIGYVVCDSEPLNFPFVLDCVTAPVSGRVIFTASAAFYIVFLIALFV